MGISFEDAYEGMIKLPVYAVGFGFVDRCIWYDGSGRMQWTWSKSILFRSN